MLSTFSPNSGSSFAEEGRTMEPGLSSVRNELNYRQSAWCFGIRTRSADKAATALFFSYAALGSRMLRMATKLAKSKDDLGCFVDSCTS